MPEIQDKDELEERQDVDSWLKWSCSGLGALLVIGVLVAVCMHFIDKDSYPKPIDIEAGLLLGTGVVLLLLFHLPWTKIRIGDIEIERAIEEQAIDHAQELGDLKKLLNQLEQNLSAEAVISPEIKTEIDKRKSLYVEESNDTELLFQFLKQWPSWGFTASRIKKWGGDKADFKRFSELSVPHIRALAANLLKEGRIRTRVSKNGNILHQASS